MNSRVRYAETDDERALMLASERGDFVNLIILLQKGVYPNLQVFRRF